VVAFGRKRHAPAVGVGIRAAGPAQRRGTRLSRPPELDSLLLGVPPAVLGEGEEHRGLRLRSGRPYFGSFSKRSLTGLQRPRLASALRPRYARRTTIEHSGEVATR
jgi:hypothetical protein